MLLARTHMQDLKDVTNDLLYESYRGQIIQVRMTRRNNDRYATINSKTESTASSIDDIVDTNNLLQEKDEEIQRIQAVLSKMQTQISNGSIDSSSALSSLNSKPVTNNSVSILSASQTLPATNSPSVSVKSSSTISSAK